MKKSLIYMPLFNKSSGGAGRFLNLLKENLQDTYEITHDINSKNLDAALLNANGLSFKDLINLKFNNPNIRIVHRLDGLLSRENRPQGDDSLNILNKKTDISIFQSKHCQDIFKNILNSKKSKIIYNGSTVQKGKSLNLEGYIKIFHLSWATGPWKQLDKLFDFIKDVENNSRVHFYTAGNYCKLEDFKSLTEYQKHYTKPNSPEFFSNNNKIFEKMKNVTYLGYLSLDKIQEYLSSVDFMFFPSIIDSCPNTVIESICCETPVIYHNSGGTPEIVMDAGIDLEKFNYDYNKIIDEIDKNLNDYKHKTIKIKNNFSFDKIKNEYLATIEECILTKKNFSGVPLNVGWIMCADTNAGSSRIGGFNLHQEFQKIGISSTILHQNKKFSVNIDVDPDTIIQKIKDLNITLIVFQKVCLGHAIKVVNYCKVNKIKIVFAIGDLIETPLYELSDLVITTSKYFEKNIKDKYPKSKVTYIDDAIEVESPIKVHTDKGKCLTVGWFGNKDKIDFLDNFKSILKNEDRLITFSNTPKATFEMGYGCEKSWDLNFITQKMRELVDVVLIPIDLSNPSNLVKSSNRLTLPLYLGIPVICSSIESYKQVYDLRFDSFYLMENNNLKEWSEKLDSLRDYKKRNEMGNLARQSVLLRHNLNTIAKEWYLSFLDIFEIK
jgi:glycosyltransferase involved in cell wall biosynthesis